MRTLGFVLMLVLSGCARSTTIYFVDRCAKFEFLTISSYYKIQSQTDIKYEISVIEGADGAGLLLDPPTEVDQSTIARMTSIPCADVAKELSNSTKLF